MNGGATVSPPFVSNLCKCGHDLVAHDQTVSPNKCSLCVRQAGVLNTHDFTAYREAWPSNFFPQAEPADTVCAGGFGFVFTMTTGAGNAKGSNQLLFLAAIDRIQVGMTFTIQAANAANSITYTVVAVNPATLTITISPALLFNSPGLTCSFQGAIGSTMGPGRPRNGQRAG